jgi:hypothetical protein
MSKSYKCPACDNEVDRAAVVCSNPECRKELAFCSYCRDVTAYTLVEKADSRFGRDRYRCERCERVGVRCLTWVAGGYCNGLARSEGTVPRPLCANCNGGIADIGRSVVSWTLIGALGGLLKRRAPGGR